MDSSRNAASSARAVFVSALLLCVAASPARAAGEPPSVEVTADQTVTVVGSFASLHSLLGDLCERAGVELRGWDAPDRSAVVDERGRSFSDVLERVLVSENYLLGMRGGEGEEPLRAVWVRVTGRADGSTASVAHGLPVPSEFGDRPFADEDPDASRRAMATLAKTLLSDDTRMAQILRLEPAEIARSLAYYPHVDQLLRKLRSQNPHPAVAAKLDAVLAELGRRAAGAATGR